MVERMVNGEDGFEGFSWVNGNDNAGDGEWLMVIYGYGKKNRPCWVAKKMIGSPNGWGLWLVNTVEVGW